MKQIHRLEISWAISRGQDTAGCNICRLDDSISGKRYRTMGGGYDMIGTVVADWFEDQYQAKLQALRTDAEMIDCGYSVPGYVKHKDQFYGLTYTPKGAARLDGRCGIESIQRIIESCGFDVQWSGNRKGATRAYYVQERE